MRHPAVWGQLWQLSFTEGSASFQLHSQSLRLLVQFLGQTLCWGGNQEGHLGSGNKLSRSQPKYVSELKEGVVQLALTTTGACAAMKSGDVFCWGSEDMILPGLPENEERLLPVLVQELKGRVKLLGLTGSGGCFLTVTNEVMCWGGKELIGMGESIDVPKNKLVLNTLVGGGVKKIAVLGNTCIIDMNDRVLCWGGNYTGQSRPGRVSYFIYTPNFIEAHKRALMFQVVRLQFRRVGVPIIAPLHKWALCGAGAQTAQGNLVMEAMWVQLHHPPEI